MERVPTTSIRAVPFPNHLSHAHKRDQESLADTADVCPFFSLRDDSDPAPACAMFVASSRITCPPGWDGCPSEILANSL